MQILHQSEKPMGSKDINNIRSGSCNNLGRPPDGAGTPQAATTTQQSLEVDKMNSKTRNNV